MNPNAWIQMLVFLLVLVALVKPLGAFMARVYEGQPCGLDKPLGWLERLTYRVGGIHPDQPMTWKIYAIAVLLFNLIGGLAVYALQRLQGSLPLNPEHLGAVSPDLAWNTAISFISTSRNTSICIHALGFIRTSPEKALR